MFVIETRVPTEHASKYIAQLCKHFKHKVPADYDDVSGMVDFQPGKCSLTAERDGLLMRCESEEESNLGRLKFILEDHLQRFAWREKPVIEWHHLG